MGNPVEEVEMVRKLVDLLALDISNPINPNTPSVETGMDVLTNFGSRKVGIQVTVYHADEGVAGQKGSLLRNEEERKAREALRQDGPKVYGSWAPADYVPPLRHRIQEKIAIAAKHTYQVDELWLLVCAQYPRYGATSSTMIASAVVDIGHLNNNFGSILANAPFDRVFLFLSSEHVVYDWRKQQGWQLLKDKTPVDQAHIEHMRGLVFGHDKDRADWLSDPEGMSERAINDCFAEFEQQRKPLE